MNNNKVERSDEVIVMEKIGTGLKKTTISRGYQILHNYYLIPPRG